MSLESTKTSRPSPTMVGVALLVIVASVAVVWLGIVQLTAPYGGSVHLGVICLVAGPVIGVCQFLGTFRRRPGALLIALVGLMGAGGLTLLGTAFFFLIALQFPGPVSELLAECGPIALGGAAAIGCALVNLQWHRQLAADRRPPLPLWRFSLREFLVASTLLAVLLGLLGYRFRGAFERNWEVNVHPTAAPLDVPLNAQEVCHAWNWTLVAVEFTVSEPQFMAWVEKRGKEHHYRWRTPLAEIKSSYEVVTYRWLRGDDATHGLAVVDNGLFLELDDGYGFLQVAYDRDHSRAYACEDLRFGYRPPEEP
jgi:hypothetical protein